MTITETIQAHLARGEVFSEAKVSTDQRHPDACITGYLPDESVVYGLDLFFTRLDPRTGGAIGRERVSFRWEAGISRDQVAAEVRAGGGRFAGSHLRLSPLVRRGPEQRITAHPGLAGRERPGSPMSQPAIPRPLYLHSPVLWQGRFCTVVALEGPDAMIAGPRTGQGWVKLDELTLDYSQPVARWQAALWVVAEGAWLATHLALSEEELALIEQVQWGEDCSSEDVEELRAMVARLQPTT